MSSAELAAKEDADMAECDEDKVVTMMDVLQEQEDFEEDANAVLGASDEKNCTFPKGYIKRQAVYACLTCCPDAKTDPGKRAGVCLACSLSCHENHELVELYTKRNFCCDCGNSKFNSHPCQFTANKPDLNDNNSYNQNFSGLYCICHRPYPDPEATFEDEMIQCVICEDWLHASHLEAKVPPNEQYSEMICKGCMEKNEFLYDYSDLAVNCESEDVDITTVNEKVNGVCNGDAEKRDLETDTKQENGDIDKFNVPTNISDEQDKVEDTDNEITKDKSGTNTGVGSTENDQMETNENQNKEKSDENLQAEQNDSDNTPSHDNSTVTDTAEMEISESKGDATTDNNVESKPEEQLSESGEDKATDEQNNSISDDKLDSKNEITNSDEKIETAIEGDKVDDTQDVNSTAEVTKDEEKNTSPSDNESNEKLEKSDKQEESLQKDDLMESIDRLINGDDDDSSKVETTGQEKSSNDENTENARTLAVKSSSEVEEEVTDGIENKDNNLNGENSDKMEPQADMDMEESISNKDDRTKSNDTEIESIKDNKRKLHDDTIDKTDVKKPKLNDCKRPTGVRTRPKGALFWPCNLREKLCTCNECLTMYKDLSVLFLIDLEDTVSAYETLGKEKNDGRSSQYEIGLQALSSLDRIQQINALTEYNKMRDKLLDFLKSFKDRKEIVKEEDIKAFFAGMKPKREPDGVYFCR
ncbi:putative E3 ubiquitin-protein ligase UBR7 [Plodia interpunctella]|uniref:putative E3 ubiquitin-protein ligase UBR7 n=1 Tax=Plodia interpunctella TaxID=58824 RepID=UPI002368E714|nr:putative E3 ubiquitin-protein ligase UBR7 [Plodia interpunctella]XP_053612765.1 putative E3 ubiquitin-protein ligase UBR7 [Plodia interpunctella]